MKRKRRKKSRRSQRSPKKELLLKSMKASGITLKTQMEFGKKFVLVSMNSEKLSCLTSVSLHTIQSKVHASRL